MWRTSNFLIDEFDYTVQRNDKRMQEVMHLDFYTVTFYSLRTKVKKEYRLLTSDSAEYYNEAMFIMGLQNVFCFSYMFYDTDFSELFCYMNDYSVNLCIMFTCLVLHFSCLQTVRNGMNMCKFVIFHSEEFEDPAWAFLLGIIVMYTNVQCELINIINALHQKKLTDVITKFIAFKVLVTI